jgi:uncharacterized coiled-coil protein SlyX
MKGGQGMGEQDQVLEQRVISLEARMKAVEGKMDDQVRVVAKLEVMMDQLGKRWDTLEKQLFELLSKLNTSAEKSTLAWSDALKESFKIIAILAGSYAAIKYGS